MWALFVCGPLLGLRISPSVPHYGGRLPSGQSAYSSGLFVCGPSGGYRLYIGTLSQTLTLRAAFASSTYLLPQIPGLGRSSDDDFLNPPNSLFKGHIRPPCAPDRRATASLFFGRHLMMPCYTFGRCFFACLVLKKFTDVEQDAQRITDGVSAF